MTATYDRIGSTYAAHRRPDPRVSAAIAGALGDAERVLDVGAGTGSYELGGRHYVAVEPSRVMLDQRAPDAAPAVQGVAERLPFSDGAFDAAMAILTVHHWPDAAAGLDEVRRVTTGPIVALTWDAEQFASTYWLVRDYLPEVALQELPLVTLTRLRGLLGPCRVEPVLVPHDCTDGFFAAYWRRPERYLEPGVRAAISGLALLDPPVVDRMVAALRDDLVSGRWHEQHADLLELDTYDAGYRLVIAEGA
ncbi:MAG: class I SAM-dependent methyltransferase [Acidimicrobiales bacterium]